jgi:hypothetical protein
VRGLCAPKVTFWGRFVPFSNFPRARENTRKTHCFQGCCDGCGRSPARTVLRLFRLLMREILDTVPEVRREMAAFRHVFQRARQKCRTNYQATIRQLSGI